MGLLLAILLFEDFFMFFDNTGSKDIPLLPLLLELPCCSKGSNIKPSFKHLIHISE